MNLLRTREFTRNEQLETLLQDLNELLTPAEEVLLERGRQPSFPVVLVVGAPRSGTTLMMQCLAASGWVAYPTNLLSRFYGAPCVGARIQQLLTDPRFNFNDELNGPGLEIDFKSRLGKTRGMLAPNEFWYFWRRFFPLVEPRCLSPVELNVADGTGFLAELAGLEKVFNKPWAMKGLILQFNLSYLAQLLDRLVVVRMSRDPLYNMQSILEARIQYFGNHQTWYSVKPPEYEALKSRDPLEQVAGQVFYTGQALDRGWKDLELKQRLEVPYEDFCENPGLYMEALGKKLREQGYTGELGNCQLGTFTSTNALRGSPAEVEGWKAAWKTVTGEDLCR